MTVKLLTEQHLEFLSLKAGCTELSESIFMSKCHIVGNLMSLLNLNFKMGTAVALFTGIALTLKQCTGL